MSGIPLFRPSTLEQAAQMLHEQGPSARVVAGATDLIGDLFTVSETPTPWVDLSKVGAEARTIRVVDDVVHIGALVTIQQLAESDLIRDSLGALWDAANLFGSIQIRTRGTLGGNLANASPAGDSLPPLLVAEARVITLSHQAARDFPLPELFLGPKRTSLAPDEIIREVQYPMFPNTFSAYLRLGDRVDHVIAKASVAMSAQLEAGRLTQVRLAFGAVAPTPIRVLEAEAVLEGHTPSDALFRRSGEAAAAAVSPIDDVRSTRAYRQDMCQELIGLVAEQVLRRAGWRG